MQAQIIKLLIIGLSDSYAEMEESKVPWQMDSDF